MSRHNQICCKKVPIMCWGFKMIDTLLQGTMLGLSSAALTCPVMRVPSQQAFLLSSLSARNTFCCKAAYEVRVNVNSASLCKLV